MTDPIHKNALGYLVWGGIVSQKIRELGWPDSKRTYDSVYTGKIDNTLLDALVQIKKRYEDRLAKINLELDTNIRTINQNSEAKLAAVRSNISSLNDGISTVQQVEADIEAERLRLIQLAQEEAERQRLAAEQEKFRQEQLAREQAYQAEQQRLAALKKQADEEARLRAINEENERKRKEQELLLTIAACVFLGICKR